MATYEIRLSADSRTSTHKIEALRSIGAVELLFTIEAKNRAEAIKETIGVLTEYEATEYGAYFPDCDEKYIRDNIKLVRKK